MVLFVSVFWKLQWSIAGICERDSCGMDCFFLSGKDVALEGQLRFIYHPELDWFLHCFHCCGLRTLFGLVDEEHLQDIQQSSRHSFWKIFCTDRCPYLLVIAISSTVFFVFGIEGMAKFILDVEFSLYRRNECHVERGCGSLYPLGGTT